MTRIVGGSAGGRRITVPAGRVVRPTSERVREALASTLEARLGTFAGLSVLDLYAGSGAVGLELLSRGASSATFVESDLSVVKVLRGNVHDLGLLGASVLHTKAEAVTVPRATASAMRFGVAFDIVFIDPPYALDIDPILSAAAPYAHQVLVIERATKSPDPSWPEGFQEPQVRRYGDTSLWYGWRS